MTSTVTDNIPLSYPDVTEREINAVVRVLRSGRLSNGPWLERFEEAIARRAKRVHGTKRVTVRIPAGVESGTRLRLAGEGEPGWGRSWHDGMGRARLVDWFFCSPVGIDPVETTTPG